MRTELAVLLTLFVFALVVACTSGAEEHHKHHYRHHHSMHTADHRFTDAEKWAEIFEAPDRARWQKPDEIVERLNFRKNLLVADIGAGTGYFAVRFAKKSKHVWAVDIEPSMVGYMARRAQSEGLRNITAVIGEPSDPKLTAPVDLVFICNTYHHFGDRSAYLSALKPKLRPGGRVVIVDFKPGDIPVGPPESERVTLKQVKVDALKAGYKVHEVDEKTLPYQYIAQFVVPKA